MFCMIQYEHLISMFSINQVVHVFMFARNQNEHQGSGSMRIHHHQKNFEQLSAVKVMASVFWDKHGVIHVDFSTPWCHYQQ